MQQAVHLYVQMPILQRKMLVGKIPNPFRSAPFWCRLERKLIHIRWSLNSEDYEVFVDSHKRCWDDNIHTAEEIRQDIVSLGIKTLTANRKRYIIKLCNTLLGEIIRLLRMILLSRVQIFSAGIN